MVKNPDIFEEHVFDEKFLLKNLIGKIPTKLKSRPDRIWLDKFAFYKIGTLLNSSPIIFVNYSDFFLLSRISFALSLRISLRNSAIDL